MTMTFNDNDTVEQTLESESVETYTIPAECFQNLFQATPQSCSDLDDSFVQDGYSSTSVCTGNPAVSCTCVDTYTENDNEILSYSTSENSITVDGDTGDYCVESDGQIIKYLPPGDSNPIVMGKE